MTFVQLTRPGAPVVLGSFASSISMQSGAPTFGTPEPALVLYVMAALARRLGVPFRSGGNLCASKVADAQAAYESAATFQPTILAGVELRAPRRRLAGGRPRDRLREVHPRQRPVRDGRGLRERRGPVRERPGPRRDPRERPGHPLPRQQPHPGELRERLLPLARSPTTTRSSSGSRTAAWTPPSGPTRSGSGCSPSTRRRRSIRASTRRSSSSSRAARRPSPTPRSERGVPPARGRLALATGGGCPRGARPRPRGPDVRAHPAQERPRPGRVRCRAAPRSP